MLLLHVYPCTMCNYFPQMQEESINPPPPMKFPKSLVAIRRLGTDPGSSA